MAEHSERARKRKRYTSRIVTLTVGDEKAAVTAHEDQLRQSSPFFRAVLDKEWLEQATGEINLPDDKPQVIEAYIDWLYRGHFDIDPPLDSDGNQHAVGTCLALAYVFGEKIQDVAFCNYIIACLLDHIDKSNKYPGETCVRIIYDGTPMDSPFRQLLSTLWAERSTTAWLKTDEAYPAEFLMDLTHAFIKQRGKSAKTSWAARKGMWMRQE